MIGTEQIVIATLLTDTTAIDKILSILPINAFTEKENMEIYAAIQELYKNGFGVDIVTVANKTKNVNYILDITKHVGYNTNIMQHVGILLDRYTRERIKYMANSILIEAMDENKQVDDILKLAGKMFNEIDIQDQPSLTSISQELPDTLNAISEAKKYIEKTGLNYTGANTGFKALNDRLTGFQPETLTIIAARPGMGKTALMLYMAEQVSLSGMVLIFSLEMSKKQLIKRAISGLSEIEYHKLTNGSISDNDLSRVIKSSEPLAESNIYIDDTPGIHIDTLIRTCRTIAKKKEIKAVFIDYLQLLRGDGGNREQEIGYISRNLKGLAKIINAPVISLAQLNRSAEGRSDKRPTLADLRDSGQIEQDADDILMLYRDEYYNAVPEEEIGKMEIITRKCRNGSVGTDYVMADLRYNKFSDCDIMPKQKISFNYLENDPF